MGAALLTLPLRAGDGEIQRIEPPAAEAKPHCHEQEDAEHAAAK